VSHSNPRILFSPEEAFARHLDEKDPQARFRERFHHPRGRDGQPLLYFCGNSLGLQPKAAKRIVEQELANWEEKGVGGHFEAATPWFDYHRRLTGPLARSTCT